MYCRDHLLSSHALGGCAFTSALFKKGTMSILTLLKRRLALFEAAEVFKQNNVSPNYFINYAIQFIFSS